VLWLNALWWQQFNAFNYQYQILQYILHHLLPQSSVTLQNPSLSQVSSPSEYLPTNPNQQSETRQNKSDQQEKK
jgi:hypothetical protein